MSATALRSHPEELIRYLLEGTSSKTGQEFFRALVRSTALAMDVAGVWVTEYVAERKVLRSLAFWMNADYVEDYEYSVIGTPCEQVLERGCLVYYPDRVIELFPNDADLPRLNAVSYVGVPLLSAEGAVMGHLSALDTRPLELAPKVESVFRIFAARAAAELSRLRAESAIRESEKRFSRLFESAMDAIFELDAELRIQRANASAASLFGLSAESLANRKLTSLLTAESAEKLCTVLGELDPQNKPFAWVPRGLGGIRSDGAQFPAEASVSHFSLACHSRYSVILRSVEHQLAAETRVLELEEATACLQREIAEQQSGTEIVGTSAAIRSVLAAVRDVAPTQAPVLIEGETGTGKELVARAIHQQSDRARKPFVRVNCAAIPAALCESEFFGHERGAFTGAATRRVGRFELANGGVLFLDEVGELPLELQPKLLRVLQEGEFEPVGSSQTRKVDVRVIAATNRDLLGEVKAGRFREDLYYRLNVFPISVPSLRDRGEDVDLLARAFLERYCSRVRTKCPELNPDGLRRLRAYHWPGNVRELQNVMERALILARGGELSLREVLPLESLSMAAKPASLAEGTAVRTKAELREFEKQTLVRALEEAKWKVAGAAGAAAALGIPPSTLSSRMKALEIKRPH
jgi:formate hydrogenlyase transcriptional activator